MKNLSMEVISFALPIIFMLHDFEEIIMVDVWQRKYKKLLEISASKPFAHWVSADSGAVAVLIEFLILLAVSLISIFFQKYLIWYGVFFVFIIHFIIHYILSFRFHHYTPGVTTAAVFMPLCLFILYDCTRQLPYGIGTLVITCFVSLSIFILFFKWLTKMIQTFGKWLSLYASKEK